MNLAVRAEKVQKAQKSDLTGWKIKPIYWLSRRMMLLVTGRRWRHVRWDLFFWFHANRREVGQRFPRRFDFMWPLCRSVAVC